MTPTTDPEREDLLATLTDMLENCDFVGDLAGKFADYVLANYVPASQAVPKPAVLGDGELREILVESLERNAHFFMHLTDHQECNEKILANEALDGIIALFASQATAAQEQHEREMLKLIDERDYAEGWADKLAYAKYGIEQIGEHSNITNPWLHAYDLLKAEAASPKKEEE